MSSGVLSLKDEAAKSTWESYTCEHAQPQNFWMGCVVLLDLKVFRTAPHSPTLLLWKFVNIAHTFDYRRLYKLTFYERLFNGYIAICLFVPGPQTHFVGVLLSHLIDVVVAVVIIIIIMMMMCSQQLPLGCF